MNQYKATIISKSMFIAPAWEFNSTDDKEAIAEVQTYVECLIVRGWQIGFIRLETTNAGEPGVVTFDFDRHVAEIYPQYGSTVQLPTS